jgi:hypothetical protein
MRILMTRRTTYSLAPLLLVFTLLWFTNPSGGQPARTWPDAIGPLAEGRSRAENCIRQLKRYGSLSQINQGEGIYTRAKSHSDGVIAGLLIALETGDAPANLTVVQLQLASTISGLAEFCNSVDDIVLAAVPPGNRDVFTSILRIVSIEPLLKAVSDGVAALYNNNQNKDALIRKTIQTQLEAARWPDFGKVEAAR